jgi:hypothetical protein
MLREALSNLFPPFHILKLIITNFTICHVWTLAIKIVVLTD